MFIPQGFLIRANECPNCRMIERESFYQLEEMQKKSSDCKTKGNQVLAMT